MIAAEVAVEPNAWRPKLVALDIDGTLLDEEQWMSPAVRDMVRRVLAAGVPIVLSTGRGLVSTRPVAERLGFDKPYLVCSNGAVTAQLHPEVEFLDIVTFDAEQILRFLLQRVPSALVAVEEVGVGYRVNAPFPPNELTGKITVQTIDELVAKPAVRVILREPGSEAEDFLDLVDRVGLHDVAYYVGYTAWLDLAPRGVSKASGLEKVVGRLGLEAADVLAVGDGRNDLEMLEWAGRGVAMGDAPDEVQDAADYVTETFSRDGVAVELARWFS